MEFFYHAILQMLPVLYRLNQIPSNHETLQVSYFFLILLIYKHGKSFTFGFRHVVSFSLEVLIEPYSFFESHLFTYLYLWTRWSIFVKQSLNQVLNCKNVRIKWRS